MKASMQKIFLDCGFYRGITLRRYIDRGIVDKSWTIYAFEPNPDLNTKQFIKDFFSDVPIILIEKAVWIEDKDVLFHIGGREDAASIAGTSGHTEPKEIMVPAIDFSKFVGEIAPYGKTVRIICSFDGEGAEFKVLEKMLEDKTIDKINELDIEFHHRLTVDYTDKDARKLIKEIKQHGVEVKLKDKLV